MGKLKILVGKPYTYEEYMKFQKAQIENDLAQIIIDRWLPGTAFLFNETFLCWCGEDFDCQYNLDKHKEICHPYINPKELIETCKRKELVKK